MSSSRGFVPVKTYHWHRSVPVTASSSDVIPLLGGVTVEPQHRFILNSLGSPGENVDLALGEAGNGDGFVVFPLGALPLEARPVFVVTLLPCFLVSSARGGSRDGSLKFAGWMPGRRQPYVVALWLCSMLVAFQRLVGGVVGHGCVFFCMIVPLSIMWSGFLHRCPLINHVVCFFLHGCPFINRVVGACACVCIGFSLGYP